MSTLGLVFKIAANTHHMKYPFYEGELPIKNGRYAHWQKKGILAFAVVTIFSLGIVFCFLIGMAYLKSKRIVQKRDEDSPLQNAAKNAGVRVPPKSQSADVGLSQKLDQAKNAIVSAIEQLSPLDDRSVMTVGLFIVQMSNGKKQTMKNDYLPFEQNNPNLKRAVQDQILAVLNAASIELNIKEKLEIEWSVLIKKSNIPQDLFYEIYGKEVKTPIKRGSNSGRNFFSQEDVRQAYEEILTEKGCPHYLLQSFEIPNR